MTVLEGRRVARVERAPTLSSAVYEQVKASIVNLSLAPGMRLVTDDLARDLGVSRTPVREAVQHLLRERLIEEVGVAGVIAVARVTPRYVEEIYELRAALEGIATRAATARLRDTDVVVLQARFDQVARDISRGERDSYYHFEEYLHDAIFVWADNSHLAATWATVRAHVERIRHVSHVTPNSQLPLGHEEHRPVLTALSRRDPEGARQSMETHLMNMSARISLRVERAGGVEG